MKLELLWFFLAWPHERSHWLKKKGGRRKKSQNKIRTKKMLGKWS
jgi:hypothetical protein